MRLRGQEEETLMDKGVRHFLTAFWKKVLVVLLIQLPSAVSHIPTRTLTLHLPSLGGSWEQLVLPAGLTFLCKGRGLPSSSVVLLLAPDPLPPLAWTPLLSLGSA